MSKSQQNQTVGAFVINNEAVYPWNVYVFTPKPNGGGKIKTKFKAKFKHLSSERRVALLDEYREHLKSSATNDTPQDDDQADVAKKALTFEEILLSEALVGFEGIKTPDGSEFESSEENKQLLLSNAWARDALMAAFITSLRGRSDEGN